ncbi:hypothetical protein KIP30_gp08 [Mycobacterium phage Pistachio]|uniref:Uncharacterized protein n=1 Tax=Mycobacterium phage Pistachio TaxID=2126722 RepID=A0A2R4A2F8_9CAUD|nr:hypothetical protein KIP30_gp08 [Mycobacterium phage Pistachio]AQT28484.1 hypothetical protein SEA_IDLEANDCOVERT_85 [Mycobacterium phage Idleandcovert]AVR57072.1 hypothetical protein PBI_PUPPY_90 [Mycobacterium phage Puppy]AVR77500.1 hypothetical protein SEA_TNGUYEN7_90 [Mycobacterium phage TNguyen7]WAB10274.1 hypothetical protein PBI_BLUEBIRD_91 [Mycobacterium phage BlueBird]AVR57161.1 hypothetical protein PBI_PISTACHIO_89 [Mycobacterium phage Pistachio]
MHRIELEDIQDYVHRHVDGEKFDQASIIRELDDTLPEQATDELDAELLIAEALDAGVLYRHIYLD